jgi:hypothetical protein
MFMAGLESGEWPLVDNTKTDKYKKPREGDPWALE